MTREYWSCRFPVYVSHATWDSGGSRVGRRRRQGSQVRRPSGRVSFIVPAFNATSTLRATVDSIREAAKDIDHEVLIVDDASIDDTYQLAVELGDIVMTRACQA